jgi:TusA-related sulfurtransferase
MVSEAPAESVAVFAVDAGSLPVGGGLLALVRPALDRLEPGGVVAVLSSARSVREDLASWCRIERHEYLGTEDLGEARQRHMIRRGALGVPRGARERGGKLAARDGRLTASDLIAAVPFPEAADPATGFAPRGTRVEPGGPAYPFALNRADAVAPPEVAALYDQAVGAQWDASRDIPWQDVKPLAPGLDAAVGQIMTFLAENELSALYVPSRFIARIHPAYVETAMFLATQLNDESRHIDVFLKRARLGGDHAGAGISSTVTSHSLHSLLVLEDFTEMSFLLSVLGEGTFVDLLRFVERHAPDAATAEIARRARIDETRHVHFGIVHVKHALSTHPALYARLEAAVRHRSATLSGVGGVPAPVVDALTILAAGGVEPSKIAAGHEAVQELMHEMHASRLKRMTHAGFSSSQAELISNLHTPNFM